MRKEFTITPLNFLCNFLHNIDIIVFLVACYATLHPALSVRWSVRWSITLYSFFLFFCGLWPHCSCSNDLVTSIMTPAHPHTTGVAVYPALFPFSVSFCVIM